MAKNENTIKRLNPKGAETKYVGFEPEWHIQPDETNRLSAFANAFQWYNYHYGKKAVSYTHLTLPTNREV